MKEDNRPIRNYKHWTFEEDDFLENKWGKMDVEKLAKRLKRSVRAVEHRAVDLGLGGLYKTGEYWMASEVAKVIGVYRSTVCNWINKHGLKAKKVNYRSQARYRIDLKDLIKWLESNQDRWNTKNLEEYALGCEPNWLKEKRKTDANKKPKKARYSKELDSKLVFLYKRNYTFEAIAEETGITVHMAKGRIKVLRESGEYNIPYKNGKTQIKSKAV